MTIYREANCMIPIGEVIEHADGTAGAATADGTLLGEFKSTNDAVAAVVQNEGVVTFYQDSAGPFSLGPSNSP